MRLGMLSTLLAAGLAAAPAGAQDAVEAGMLVWQNNGCANCHGEFGEGGEGGHFPAGPALRRSSLAKDHLRETIACGRPGTEMPSNLKGAYITVPCYGLPLAAAMPAGTMGGVAMTEPEILAAARSWFDNHAHGKAGY